jgi:arabinan endo-1,5-alpha-L-arabinosidase
MEVLSMRSVALGLMVAVLLAAPAAGSAQKASTYTNPVLDRDFPDPTVIRASDGLFYAYATQTELEGKTLNIQVARSRDLVEWEHLGDALPVKPSWAKATQNTWAPHVAEHDGTYYMYYSAEIDPGEKGLCLAVATSKSPSGPFTDVGKPLLCGETFVNIDPMSFDDPKTGKRLLYWGSGHKPIKVQELAPDRISFAPGSSPVDVVFPKQGPSYERLVEGAWVVYRDGTYYLFYSGDNCCGENAHYAVMVARSKSAAGPFETRGEALGRAESPILVERGAWAAPGHNSIVTDAAGRDWMVYHAMHPRAKAGEKRDERRVMLVDRVTYRNGWPEVEGGVPSTGPRPRPKVR